MDDTKKADIVVACVAIIAANDPSIDLASLIIELWIGHDGEMPETLHYGMLGNIMMMAMSIIDVA